MMRHRNDLMLLRIAQADAYALAYEYVKDQDAPGLRDELLKLERYHQHPTYHKMQPGSYSDDGQMSIAIAELLIDPGLSGWNAQRIIDRFFECFKRDQRDGYSRAFQALLEESRTPDELRLKIKPNSTANGAAMRSVPLGVIKDPKHLVVYAGLQAGTTHCTYGGINSSIAVALMSHFALYDRRDFSSMLQWGNQHCWIFEQFREPWVGPVQARKVPGDPGVGLNTAHAVCTLLTTQTSLMGIMRQVIEWGGDTDSVASIAWGIASARYPDEVLPEFLERDLEANNATYGPAFLRSLGTRLMDAYA